MGGLTHEKQQPLKKTEGRLGGVLCVEKKSMSDIIGVRPGDGRKASISQSALVTPHTCS